MKTMIRKRLIPALAAITCLWAQAANACSFDGFPIPVSLVDTLMANDQIVLARPDPKQTLRFEIAETLQGDPGAATVPNTLAGMERTRLIANPGDAVMFARRGYFGDWQRIGYVPARHRGLFEQIVARLPDWRRGQTGDRAELFAPHAADDDPLVRTTALVELGRLQYASLRSMEYRWDTDRILDRLPVLSEQHLMPVRLQLIGLSQDGSALAGLGDRLAEAVRANDPNVKHYATAYVELAGAGAVQNLSEIYLGDPGWPLDARRRIMEAIDLHLREGDPRLRTVLQWVFQQAQLGTPELMPTGIGGFHGDIRRIQARPAAMLSLPGSG